MYLVAAWKVGCARWDAYGNDAVMRCGRVEHDSPDILITHHPGLARTRYRTSYEV